LTRAGAGRILTAIILAVFTFCNVSSAKSRGSHKVSKDQTAHRQSKLSRKSVKERPTGRQSRIARKNKREERADRHSRLAFAPSKRSGKRERASRQDRLAQKQRREQPSGRRSRVAERTTTGRTNKQSVEGYSNNQIVGGAQRTQTEPKTFSAPQVTVQTRKPAETQTNPDLENAVIPPSPVIVKKKANAILIPVGLADPDLKAKFDNQSDTQSDATPESKYEERAVVSSEVASGPSVGSSFGYRRDPFTRRAKFHSGVDLKARWGDAVGASQAGIVQFAGWHHGYGNMVIVAHGGGVTTQYAHLSSFDVEPGAHVERGTIIGRAGSTGRATSPHLHYEVRIDGTAMDPLQPLALDPSSDYFKLSRPTVDAGRGSTTQTAGSSRDK
jgi:murein DD-endopeptidase MepM/ murein hydrolase activator NlpD